MKAQVETPEYMGDHAMTFVIIVSSLASVVAVIVVVLLCSCCYRRKSDSDGEDSDDDVDKSYYAPIATDDRQDVRQLRTHSWKERADHRNKSPLLTRKAIKFERPADKKIVTENVQPEPYAQSSINRTLGIIARELLNKGSSDNNGLEGEEGDPTHAQSPRSNGSAVTGLNASSPIGSPVRASASGVGPRIADDDEIGAAAAAAAAAAAISDIDYIGEKLGRIQFSINYNFQEMTLTLKIHKAVDLPAKDFSGTSDPYVKILLLPDRKHKLETKIKRKNLNPRWNEAFAFEGFPYSKIQNRTLYMQVLDYDRFSRDDPIGEVVIPLGDLDLTREHTMWKNLAPCKGSSGKLGELLLSLCYQPTVGRITVVAMKARELKARDVNGYSDPYVKIWLMHDGKKVEKKKTQVHQKNLNPVFNESFIFQVPFENIRTTGLLVSVMDYDRMSRNDVIGQVLISAKSGPMEVKHWNEMLAKSRQPVAQWHILKDFS